MPNGINKYLFESKLRQSIKGSGNKLQRISSFIDQVEARLHKEQQLFCEKIACSMGLSAEVINATKLLIKDLKVVVF